MIGLFNHTLTRQTITRTDDSAGGYVESWTDGATFRARICPLTAQERMMQDKTTPFITHRIYCSNMTITEEDRIKWGIYYFEILGIRNPSEMYHHLEIDVREVV